MGKNLIVIFIFIIGLSLYAQDKTSDVKNPISKNQKAIEFSIGGDLIHSFSLIFQEIDDKYYSNDFYEQENYKLFEFIPSQSVEISMPISFIVYPNSNFGIGIMNQLGLSCVFRGGIYPPSEPVTFTNRIKIIKKFGNIDKKKWFLLEYGININNGFNLWNQSFTGLLIGPNVFIGYEKFYNNKFEFTIGFNFNATYYNIIFDEYSYYFLSPEIYTQTWFLDFGIEFRWKFAVLYKFKNN